MSLSLYYFLEISAIFTILGWTLYLAYRIGQLNNTAIATMQIGGFISSFLVLRYDWHFIPALVVALIACLVFVIIPALALGRAPSFTMVIASIALIFIAKTFFKNVPWFGGTSGLFGLPKIGYLLPLTYAFLIIIGVGIYIFDHSRLGRAASIAFMDRDIAGTMGINFYLFSVVMQLVVGLMGGIAGVFYAFTLRTISADYFGIGILLTITTFVFVGGYTTMWGTLIFAPILWGLPTLLPNSMLVYRNIIYGLLLMFVMIYKTEGIIDKRLIRNLGKKLSFIRIKK